MDQFNNELIIVRGGGDIATGTIHRLVRCGFSVLVLEIRQPAVIRHTVSFAQAVFERVKTVEEVTARRISSIKELNQVIDNGEVAVLVDEEGESISRLKPAVVIDAILAKRNLGTTLKMAQLVIGLGPGFEAGKDVHAVIETNRGHFLGRIILRGGAEPNTGVPGDIGGYTDERVIRAECPGVVKTISEIGDLVEQGELVMRVGTEDVVAPISGILRGLINSGLEVPIGFKIGDIDPRASAEHCFTISDKARTISGGVLELILSFNSKRR